MLRLEVAAQGCSNLNLFFDSLAFYRFVGTTEHHTMRDFAPNMKWLVDERHPQAEVIRVVLDNLNTHKPAVL